MNESCSFFASNFSNQDDFLSVSQLDVPCLNSTRELSLPLYDYSNVFLLPAICVFGIITSGINIIVILRTGITENIHLYILIGTTSDFLFLLIQVFIALFRCGTLCPFGYKYASKVYELYVYLYVGYVIVTFSAMVDISVSIDRIRLFNRNNKVASRRQFAVRCLILFILSAALILPEYMLSREIVPKAVLVTSPPNSTVFTFELLYSTEMRKSWMIPSAQISLYALGFIKGPVLIVTVLVVCLVLVKKLRNHQIHKREMTIFTLDRKERRNEREMNRASYMVISMSLLYFFGNAIDCVNPMVEALGVDVYDTLPFVVVIGNVFLFGLHGLYIFIYYNFCRDYKRIFKRMMLRRSDVTTISATDSMLPY